VTTDTTAPGHRADGTTTRAADTSVAGTWLGQDVSDSWPARAGRRLYNISWRTLSRRAPEYRWLRARFDRALRDDDLPAFLDWQVARVVELARCHTDIYRDVESGVFAGGVGTVDLHRLPETSKDLFRRLPETVWRGRHLRARQIVREVTSGSTGAPFMFYRDRTLSRYALLHEVSAEFDRWFEQRGVTRYVFMTGLRGMRRYRHERRAPYPDRLFIPAHDSARFADVVREHNPQIIGGLSQGIHAMVKALAESGGMPPALAGIQFTSEYLSQAQQEEIGRLSGVSVLGLYGSMEVSGMLAQSCRHGRYHVHPLVGHVEILDGAGRAVAPGEEGRLVVTSFVHTATPFVRYDTGDTARALDPQGACPCGCPYPAFDALWVTRRDLVPLRDDGQISVTKLVVDLIHLQPQLIPALKGYQFRKEADGSLTMRVMAESRSLAPSLVAELQNVADRVYADRLRIRVHAVDELQRTPSGKHLLLIDGTGAVSPR